MLVGGTGVSDSGEEEVGLEKQGRGGVRRGKREGRERMGEWGEKCMVTANERCGFCFAIVLIIRPPKPTLHSSSFPEFPPPPP